MSSDDLRRPLRQQLTRAVRERDRIAAGALRDAIAALDNAEAVRPDQDAATQFSEYVAGGVVGLGTAEAERRVLDIESQRAIVRADVEAWLAAAATYRNTGSMHAPKSFDQAQRYCLPYRMRVTGATRSVRPLRAELVEAVCALRRAQGALKPTVCRGGLR